MSLDTALELALITIGALLAISETLGLKADARANGILHALKLWLKFRELKAKS